MRLNLNIFKASLLVISVGSMSLTSYGSDRNFEPYLAQNMRYADLYHINLTRLSLDRCDHDCQVESSLNLSRLSIFMGDYESAYTHLNYAQQKDPKYKAIRVLRAYSYMLQGRKNDWQSELLKTDHDRLEDFRLMSYLVGNTMHKRKEISEITHQLKNKKIKQMSMKLNKHRIYNPHLAGTLSLIIPGSGFLYLSMWRSALLSSTLTALSYWAAYDLYEKDQQGAAIVAALVGSVFHIGGVFGAIDASLEINRKNTREITEQIINEALPEIQMNLNISL